MRGFVENKTKLWVWIDVTSRCNLSCSLCYTKKSHSSSNLQPEQLKLIYEKLSFSSLIEIQVLHLNWRGEPMMNPKLPELLAITKDQMGHLPMHWHTNGTLMTKEKAREIIEVSHPHKIYFSIDGGSQISHDLNRGEGTFNLAKKGLKNILEANNSEKRLQIGIYQLDLNESHDQYDTEFLELTQEVDEWVRINPLLPTGDELIFGSRPKLNGGDPIIRSWESLEAQNTIPEGACFWAGNAICIAPNGSVSVCLLSHSDDGIIGNIYNDDLDNILANALEFRKELKMKGRSNLPHCKNCLKPCGEAHQELKNPPAVAAS